MQGDPQKTGDQDFETGRINFHLGLLYTVPWFTQFLYNILKWPNFRVTRYPLENSLYTTSLTSRHHWLEALFPTWTLLHLGVWKISWCAWNLLCLAPFWIFRVPCFTRVIHCSAFWLVYFPVRLRDLARAPSSPWPRVLSSSSFWRFSCVWNMYQLMDRRFPGGLCHLVYSVDLNDSSSLIRITHNRMKHFFTWTHQAVSCNGCIQIKMNKYTHASMFMVYTAVCFNTSPWKPWLMLWL